MISRDNTSRNASSQGLTNWCTQSSLRCPVSYLLVDHQVAHALRGCLSKLVMILKHIVFNIWQGPLFDYLHPVLKSSQIKYIMGQAVTNLKNINCRQGRALKQISVLVLMTCGSFPMQIRFMSFLFLRKMCHSHFPSDFINLSGLRPLQLCQR